MNAIYKIVPFFLLLVTSISFSSSKEIDIGVNGMVCGFCAQGISKKFYQDPAIEKVKVSLENKLVYLQLKDGKDISDDTIKHVLNEAGFSVSSITRK